MRVVLRELLSNTETSLIKTAVEMEGFSNITVIQLYRGSISNKKKLMPLFLVSIPKMQDTTIMNFFCRRILRNPG